MRRKLLYLVNADWFFCSHFLDRAIAAHNAGFEVVVVTNIDQHLSTITSAGIRVIALPISRRGINPFLEFRAFLAIWRTYKAERPVLAHHIALKPILYGTAAAKLCGIKAVINAPVGMGYVFTADRWLASMLRPLVRLGLRTLLNPPGSRVVFENSDDLEELAVARIVRQEASVLIRGSGVDLSLFPARPEPPGIPVVILAARMLWDKGVREYVDAARRLRECGIAARFWLVGAPDTGNPSAIATSQLQAWHDARVVEWLGYRQDIPELLSASHIVCLPSYREGLPKFLLEGMAAGRPIVTTDVPGCREVVLSGLNGLLVPPRDASALADALTSLIAAPQLRQSMGGHSRELAEAHFTKERVVSDTLALYRSLCE